ncbi:MAG: EAL domain-containing protein [gamma proteobacterium endosymbiont of Lamellibrachia anaximandri]|nr:EAL domain-containing protein [gamma proteobacterium endosymbiont of Lamellibrachia anaximandri]
MTAHVAHKIQQNLLPPFELTQDSIHLTASIGISLYPGDAGDPVTLLKNADTAMYRAKAEGKNTFHFYTRELTASANSRFSLENQLRLALKRDEFELFYQPQFDLNSGRISGAEALIRWNHSERGLVSPAEFIWLAEETGLIIPIGAWVIKSACHQAKKWFDDGRLNGRISVNLSALQIMQEETYSVVRLALEESGLSPDRLELEITESALIGQHEKVSLVADAFKSLGISLAIDDFGTGYSSLAYLKRFHIDRLKIDRSFVRDIPGDPNDMAIIRAIIAMGHTLGLSIVAEGVETEAQANFLTGVGCNDVQGYLYGRPVPCDQFQI